MSRLRESGRGAEDDREFLEKRMLGEQIPRVWADLNRVARTAPAPRLPAGSAVVVFKDGRKIAGTIVELDDKHLKIKARLGTLTVERNDVLRVEPVPE